MDLSRDLLQKSNKNSRSSFKIKLNQRMMIYSSNKIYTIKCLAIQIVKEIVLVWKKTNNHKDRLKRKIKKVILQTTTIHLTNSIIKFYQNK